MRAEVRLEKDRLHFRCQEPRINESRKLDEDFKKFEEWALSYRQALPRPNNEKTLLAIGRKMREWLDGGERWLQRLEKSWQPPFIVEFSVPSTKPGENENMFLEAPWELLALDGGFLAADPGILYSPVRRLGKAGSPPDPSPYRLSMVFMAAAPRGERHLNFEAEEAAFLEATGSIGLDLTVDESGTLPLLAECVARTAGADTLDVLHLSCHGTASPQPTLLLEDDEGVPHRVTARKLATELGGKRPRLLCLSACETDVPDRMLGSSAASMISRGAPAVLGWSGPVRDAAATRFAAMLYGRLALHETVEESVARARHTLLAPGDTLAAGGQRSEDWHRARLTLGPHGGGVLCCGERARGREDLTYNYRAFLNERDSEVPVAGPREFVGRRRPIQEILAAFRSRHLDARPAGVLVHGMGRQGKSSLAARIAHRLKEHIPVVLHGRFDARAVLEVFSRFVGTGAVAEIVERYRDQVEDDPETLTTALRELLEGPCKQLRPEATARPAQHPVLLVVDDFEQLLEATSDGLHRVEGDLIPAVRAIIGAFDAADTTSRLLFTSRHTFRLPDEGRDLARRLHWLHLPPMLEYEGRKQAYAKWQALRAGEKQEDKKAHLPAIDPARTERVITAARGNPGLQNMLFGLGLEAPESCDEALKALHAFLEDGRAPDQEEVAEFLERIALNTLVGLLSEGEKGFLRTATLFESPVPVEILTRLAREAGLPVNEHVLLRLFGLGLLEAYEDPVRPGKPAAAVNALARPKFGRLSDTEKAALAPLAAGPLFELWGGTEGARSRPFSADEELTRLAILARDAVILMVTAEDAVRGMENRFRYTTAADLGCRSIEILEEAHKSPSLGLLQKTGENCMIAGDTRTARALFNSILELISTTGGKLNGVDPQEHARALICNARLDFQCGNLEKALESFEMAEKLLNSKCNQRERSIALVYIARIFHLKGQLDEALKIYYETIRVFENIGDSRSRTVTLGDIARIYIDKKRFDDAHKLLKEKLKIYEDLGEKRSRAVTLGDIARIYVSKGQVDEALNIHQERIRIYEDIGDKRERAVTIEDIARICVDREQVDEALELHQEALLAFNDLADLAGQSACLRDIANIELSRNHHEAALAHLSSSYEILTKTGHLDGIAMVGLDLGQLLCGAGQTKDGLVVLRRSRDGFQQLGWTKLVARVDSILAQYDKDGQTQAGEGAV